MQVDQRAFLGGGCTIHQFCRIGRLAIIGGNEATSRDVPPFAAERYGALKGYNAIGCRRAGFSLESIASVRAAYHCIHTHRTTTGIVASIKATVAMTPEVTELLEFIATSKRGILPSGKFAYFLRAGDADPE